MSFLYWYYNREFFFYGHVASFNAICIRGKSQEKTQCPLILMIFCDLIHNPSSLLRELPLSFAKNCVFFVPVILVCIYISFYIRQNALDINALSLPSKMKRNRFTYHMHASSSISTWQKKEAWPCWHCFA